jgi:parallel beta-helix repeat protein
MTQEATSGNGVAERIRTADIAVGGNSPVTAMLANSLKERKPLADTGELYDSIQAAENDASAFIFVPPGTFNESVTIDTAGLTLLGCGRASLINGGTIGDAINITADNVTVESLSVETTAGGGNLHNGITVDTGGDSCTFSNIHVTQSDNDGFFISDGADHSVENCYVENADDRPIQSQRPRTLVTGCVVENSAGGIRLDSDADDSIVANCIVRDSSGNGINLKPTGGDCIAIGNRVDNTAQDGIGTNSDDNIIANNRISDCARNLDIIGSGITLDGNLTGPAN